MDNVKSRGFLKRFVSIRAQDGKKNTSREAIRMLHENGQPKCTDCFLPMPVTSWSGELDSLYSSLDDPRRIFFECGSWACCFFAAGFP